MTEQVDRDGGLEIRSVGVVYQTASGHAVEALADVNAFVNRHEFVAVLGPSGCGKSTLLRVAAGLLPPTSGDVCFAGEPPSELRSSYRLGMVFQDPALLPWRSVLDNVLFPFELAGRRRARQQALGLIRLVGLRGFERALPAELSGGMRSRVAIARALALDPELLLMDECFGSLDELTRQALHCELLSVWTDLRPTVLFVTHDVAEAVFLADRVLVMSPRPAHIAGEVTVELPRPRDPSTLDDPAFFELTKRARHLLADGSKEWDRHE